MMLPNMSLGIAYEATRKMLVHAHENFEHGQYRWLRSFEAPQRLKLEVLIAER